MFYTGVRMTHTSGGGGHSELKMLVVYPNKKWGMGLSYLKIGGISVCFSQETTVKVTVCWCPVPDLESLDNSFSVWSLANLMDSACKNPKSSWRGMRVCEPPATFPRCLTWERRLHQLPTGWTEQPVDSTWNKRAIQTFPALIYDPEVTNLI